MLERGMGCYGAARRRWQVVEGWEGAQATVSSAHTHAQGSGRLRVQCAGVCGRGGAWSGARVGDNSLVSLGAGRGGHQ